MSDQRVFPMIDYEDAGRAIDFLTEAFGFVENRKNRYIEPDGRISHAQLSLDGGAIMLGGSIDGYEGPDRHAARCVAAQTWLDTPYIVDGVLVYVNDLDAHFDRAQSAGARILSIIEDDGPGRLYRAADCEGTPLDVHAALAATVDVTAPTSRRRAGPSRIGRGLRPRHVPDGVSPSGGARRTCGCRTWTRTTARPS